ncbi:redoxin domain-containing protein [bacterium]|nr:redoxin domain-containing protein [bacterium]
MKIGNFLGLLCAAIFVVLVSTLSAQAQLGGTSTNKATANPALNVALQNADGGKTSLADLVRKGQKPLVVFAVEVDCQGMPVLKPYLNELIERVKSQAEVVFIYTCKPTCAREFRKTVGIKGGTWLSDTKLQVLQGYGRQEKDRLPLTLSGQCLVITSGLTVRPVVFPKPPSGVRNFQPYAGVDQLIGAKGPCAAKVTVPAGQKLTYCLVGESPHDH